MSWRIRCFVVSLSFLLTASALAQSKPQSPVFISEVELITSWGSDPSIERSLIETFKELLRLHGYETDDCQENAEAWQRIARRETTPNDIEVHRKIDRLIAAQKCTVPFDAERAYNVKLILDYDKLLNNRRAVLRLVALGDYDSLDGGYAHKPGELTGWYDLMNRAIERALSRYNEKTTIRVDVPDEATVGDTVRLDGRGSWDPDGDAFELRWRVTVEACIGEGRALPRDGLSCPSGTLPGDHVVRDQAGTHDLTREFDAPMIGDYRIEVRAKIGAREEPVRSFQLRVFPQRDWTFFARIGFYPLPKFYQGDSGDNEMGYVSGFGLMKRFIHRVGWFGWYEEVHFGLSINPISELSDYNFEGRDTSMALGFDIIGRLLDRTGRYGLVSSSMMSAVVTNAVRAGVEREEWGWMVQASFAGYYTFGNNYLDERTKLCHDVCPSITLGPTLNVMHNIDAGRVGISLGVQTTVGLEF